MLQGFPYWPDACRRSGPELVDDPRFATDELLMANGAAAADVVAAELLRHRWQWRERLAGIEGPVGTVAEHLRLADDPLAQGERLPPGPANQPTESRSTRGDPGAVRRRSVPRPVAAPTSTNAATRSSRRARARRGHDRRPEDERRRGVTLLVSAELVEPFARALLGAIDVDGGPTDEQLAVLQALVTHLWERDDLDLGDPRAARARRAAAAITDPDARRRLCELMVTLELCRHPRVGGAGRPRRGVRARAGVERARAGDHAAIGSTGSSAATADFDRFYGERLPTSRSRRCATDT